MKRIDEFPEEMEMPIREDEYYDFEEELERDKNIDDASEYYM